MLTNRRRSVKQIIYRTLTRTVLPLIALIAIPSLGLSAVKTWDGDAGDSLWGSPSNWNSNTLPTASDDVILNNAGRSGTYLVSISTGVSAVCRTLTVGYTGNLNTITLRVSSFSTAVPALTVGGNTAAGVDDFVVHDGGVFLNQSGATAGSVVVDTNNNAGNTVRIKAGGTLTHQSATSFAGSFPSSGAGATTFESGSTLRFAADTPMVLSGRTFGNLSFFGGACTVPSATGTLTVQNDLTVETGASLDLSPHTGSTTFSGDITNNGTPTLVIAGPATGPAFNGTSTIRSPGTSGAVKFENGFTVNSSRSLTLENTVTVSGGKNITVNGTLAFGPTGNISHGGGAGVETLIVNAGAKLKSARADGFEGSLDTPGVLSFSTGADLVFNSAASHFSGATRTPATVRNLTISNASGVQTALSVNLTVNGSLTVDDGSTLATAARTLTLTGAIHSVAGLLTSSDGGALTVSPASTLTLTGATGPLMNGTCSISGALVFGNTAPMTGTGNFALNSGGSLTLRHSDGVLLTGAAGQIRTSNRSFATGSHFTFSGSFAQFTGNAIPASVASLTVNNTAGVTLSQEVTASSNLALSGGNLITGAHLITVGTSAASPGTISPIIGSVAGNLKRFIPASATSTLFPLSEGASSRAVTVDYSPGAPTVGGSLTASFSTADPGGDPLNLEEAPVQLVNVADDGSWTLTSGNSLAGGSYDLSLTVGGFAALGDTSTLRIVKRSSGGDPWALDGVAGSNSSTIVRRQSMSGFSEFAIAGGSNQVPVALSAFEME